MENKFYLVGTNELSVNINKPTVIFKEHYFSLQGFLGGSDGKVSVYNEGDWGSTPGLGRSPGEEKGYPLQCSSLENSMDCIVHGVTKIWT